MSWCTIGPWRGSVNRRTARIDSFVHNVTTQTEKRDMETVYPMVPAGPKPLWLFVPAMLLMLAGVALLLATTHGSQLSRFIVTDQALRLRGDLYGRTIALQELQLDRARIANLAMESTLQPASRRLGTGAPNYAAGGV